MLFPHPHPSFEKDDPLPHKARIRIIQIKELHPQFVSFPHPQFVATRSLIRKPPKYLHCILCVYKKEVTNIRDFTERKSFVILKCSSVMEKEAET